MGKLIEAHRSITGGWYDCLRFFNLGPAHSLRALLAGGFGKLAEGPRPLIEAYTRVLQECGVAVSSPPSRPPVWWDGERWVEAVEGQLFAVIVCRSFIVCSAVTAQRE